MPSKASQHIAFFIVLFVSAGMHWFVYTNLRRVLLRDYPKIGKKLAKIALWMFIGLDSPFLFIYFRGLTHAALTVLSRILLYPFLVWQTIMLMWALILVPITLWNWLRTPVGKLLRALQSTSKKSNQDNEKNMELDVATE